MFVKICGITNEEDALLAVAMGADAVGFVFAPSPRRVIPTDVRDIVRRLPTEILTVGVFRDEHPERVVEIVREAGLEAAQLHGHESVEDVAFVRARLSTVIQGFVAGEDADTRAVHSPADMILVDGASPGSGKVFDWTLVAGVPMGARFILAGGLTPDNVDDAIRAARPWGVDVSSGVEAKPGRKDARKVRQFVAAAKAAGARYTTSDWKPESFDGPRPYNWEEDR